MRKQIKLDAVGLWLTLSLLMVPFVYLPLTAVDFAYARGLHAAAGILAAGLLVLLLLRLREQITRAVQIKWMVLSVAVFFGFTIVGQLLGYQSILYYLSGLRNNGRYFIFFFACIFFLRAEQRDTFMKLLDVVFVVNFLLTLYQFFVLDIGWDYLGGIFGTQPGCNAYTNVLLLIVISYSMLGYMNQREKAWVCLAKCAMAMIVTAMAELKIFILEFGVIAAWVLLVTKFSRRKIFLLIGAVIGLVAGVRLLIFIFPSWSNWFNLRTIWETATSERGYTSQGDWNRLTAVPIAWNTFLNTWPQKLFGLGLGNCDFGPTGSMTSPFYNTYYMTNYTMFSSGYIMLETGVVGMVTYLGFFGVVFAAAGSLKRSGRADVVYCQLTQLLAVMSVALFLYNCTLRTETGFLLYFALALAFAGTKDGPEAMKQ